MFSSIGAIVILFSFAELVVFLHLYVQYGIHLQYGMHLQYGIHFYVTSVANNVIKWRQ